MKVCDIIEKIFRGVRMLAGRHVIEPGDLSITEIWL